MPAHINFTPLAHINLRFPFRTSFTNQQNGAFSPTFRLARRHTVSRMAPRRRLLFGGLTSGGASGASGSSTLSVLGATSASCFCQEKDSAVPYV